MNDIGGDMQLGIGRSTAVMFANRWRLLLALAFVLHIMLVLPSLTPNLTDIGMFDESSYVEMGRTFRLTKLPALDETPLTALFYAITYLPVQNSEFWLIHSCTIGRFVLFALLWISAYLLAKRTSNIPTPLMMIGFLFLSPAVTSLITNGNHALFTAISTFALAEIIAFYRWRELRSLWIASVLVSLALLTRMGEGTFLLISFMTIATFLGILFRMLRPTLFAAIIPVMVIVGGYLLMCYGSTGKSPLGTGEYLYGTFEQGHALAYGDEVRGQSWAEGEIEAQRLFGTSEENHNSVVAAIKRNPTAYLSRVPRLAKIALATAIGAYGGPVAYGGALSLWLFLLSLQGCIELIRKHQFALLCFFVLWPSYMLIYVLLVFQPTHFLFPFSVVFCLASIGLTAIVTLPVQQRYLWSLVLVSITALAIGRDSSLSFILSPLVLLTGLWIVWILANEQRQFQILNASAIIFLFSLMMLFRGPIPPQKIRKLGIAPEEQAVLFLRRNFPENTRMAAYSIVPRAAKMNRVNLLGLVLRQNSAKQSSEQDLRQWVVDNKVEAIYVDNNVRRYEALWALIEREIGDSLEIAFVSDQRESEVLRVTENARLLSKTSS